ncbi:MAG: PAS domain S-box protein [Deltaproteobacteria bacterium]|nr:PAS domain S-box protein [Deltaproteobacteria bacterium]
MKDEDKTKEKLIRELTDLRRRLIELESSETKQRKMLRDLRKSEERYRLLVESSSDFIWEVDANGIYTYANPKIKDLLGYEPEEIIGKTPFDLMPAYEVERVARLFKDIFESQKPFQELENTNLHKDGHHVVLDTSGVPIFDTNGNFSGYRGIDRDISKRKKTEKRLNDYQNQLRSLTSQLTLTEERARRRIATDLHDRIGQALAMSKIKLGSLRESASSIGLDGDVDKIRDLIEQTIQDTRSLIFDICPPLLYELGFEKAVEWLLENIQEQHGINVLFEDDGIPKPLDDDIRVLLYQTVRELLMNVVKHAQAKKVMVSFKGNRGHIKISVEDDGIGFDSSNILSSVGKPEGFGLFRIVERLHYLGGEIQFESKPHHGTKISMVVPTEQSGQTRKEEVK